MSELGDDFREMREHRKQYREGNYHKNMRLLRESKYKFKELNNGYHIKINGYDFWPSSGLYKNRMLKTEGLGITGLFKELENE